MGNVDGWPLTGRDHELAAVVAALDGTAGVIVRGPAGVGKTRLVAEAVATLAAAVPVHRVTGVPGLAEVPLGALVPLVGTAFGAAASSRLAEVLAPVGGRRPILTVDDAQLLDPVSAGLVQQATSAGWAHLALTVRSGEPIPPELERLWASGLLTPVELGPLSDERLADLLVGALAATVEEGSSRALVAAAHGNVLYLRELVAGSVAAGVLVADHGVWRLRGQLVGSPALEEIIAARLAGLDFDAREVVEVLAVSGAIPLRLLRGLVDLDLVEGLERAGLVRLAGDPSAPEVDLAHPLHGEVVRRGLPALARLRISRALVASVTDAGDPPAGYELRVARWIDDAGADSAGVDPTVLAELAQRAVEVGDTALAARLAEAAYRTGDDLAPALVAQWCRGELGDPAGAQALLSDVAADAERRGVDSLEQGVVAIERAGLVWWFDQDTEAARALLDEAVALGSDGADLARAQHAVFDALEGRLTRAIERATPLADHPARMVAAVAAAALGPSLAYADRPVDAADVATAGFAHALAVDGILPGNPGVHVVSQIFAAVVAGSVEAAAGFAELVRAGAATQPSRQARAWATFASGIVALVAGRLGEARDLCTQSDVLWLDAGLPGMARWPGTHAALAAAEQGDAEAVATALARHEAVRIDGFALNEPRRRQAWAWAALLTGDRAGAVAETRAAADVAAAGGSLAAEAESLHLLARWGLISEVASVLGRFAALDLASPLSRLRRDHARAVVAADGAALDEVAAGFAELGAVVLAAEAAAQAARVHRGAGRAKAAERSAARSAALLDGLAPADRPATPALADRRDRQGLSKREGEVARLAARGCSNKDIAATLVVSERTVENHLYRIFTKLGITSRTELAAALDE
jgi:DNA-binding CsgD family transcriptional regulator